MLKERVEMRKRILLAISVSTLLLSSMLSMLPLTKVYASTTHHVYPWQSIQEAINSAQPGDTIFVHNGTYYENVVVNKTVSLVGENREKTVIDGNGNGTVLYVFAHNVNISGFTLRNSGHWHFDGGIYLNNSQGCSIDGNKIDVEGSGIIVSGGSENRLMNNRIGPSYSWYGIYLINSSGNVIVGNVQSTSDVGIKLEGSCGNNISGNHITDSIAGHIVLDFGSDNNSITNNELYAIFPTLFNIRLSDSDGNAIYHNNLYSYFMKQVFVDHTNNVWDNGYPNGGNYWNDYNGTDFYSGPYQNETGSDGIGDAPYVIDESNQDNYPLMEPWSLPVHNINTGLGYATIQEAINAPETLDGHTISVSSGTYYEHVFVNKTLSLVGENRNNTIIDGNWTVGNGIKIMANNVSISGFTIKNNGLGEQKDTGNGVYVYGSIGGISITDNIIFNNTNGVFLRDYPFGSSVIGNIVINNNWEGIYLDGASDNHIEGNLVTDSNHGILLEGSSNNAIVENMILNNHYGIDVHSYSVDNVVYRNNFVNNTNQALLESSTSSAVWDNGCEGNYWSNYNGTDLDGDGIGDEYLPWEEVDFYPLMNPYMEGDVNHDLVVDLFDIVYVAVRYARARTQPYKACADINCDGIIDLYDLVGVAIHYGETW